MMYEFSICLQVAALRPLSLTLEKLKFKLTPSLHPCLFKPLMASFPTSFLTNREWQTPPQPLFSMSLSALTQYAATSKQSWAEYKAHHHRACATSTTSVPSFPGTLLPGESWLSDSLQIMTLSQHNQSVHATSHLSLGTVLMCAKGITIDNYEKHCLEPLDFYNELVAIVANGDTFAERLIERLTELCPRDDDECDKIAADDPTLGSAEFQANLFAILDQKGARNNTITNQWLLRVAVKCNRNCFREAGLFPIASKFNHSCYPNCVAYFQQRTQTLVVRTTSYVSAGSELNVTYLPEDTLYMPTDQRRTVLLQQYGFVCECVRCDPLITSKVAGMTPLQLLKRQRSERMLEAMKCPSCATENRDGNGESMANTSSMCIPIDDHRFKGVDPQKGWHTCTTCRKIPSIDLDHILVHCCNQVITIVQLASEGTLPSNLEVTQVEQILDLIHATTEHLNDTVNIGHWLSCRLHDAAYRLTRSLSIRCRRYKALHVLYDRAVNMCAIHSRIAIMAWAPIVSSTSNYMGHLLQRSGEAINAEASLLEKSKDATIMEEREELLTEAKELGRQAHYVLHGICGEYK